MPWQIASEKRGNYFPDHFQAQMHSEGHSQIHSGLHYQAAAAEAELLSPREPGPYRVSARRRP